tara:strand:- start:315 stop:470 length:156 start_codon:yes stop_codon:yes gene_type:complete
MPIVFPSLAANLSLTKALTKKLTAAKTELQAKHYNFHEARLLASNELKDLA